MLSKSEKTSLREDIFRHLDGIAIAPVAYTLYDKGICEILLEKKQVEISALAGITNANEGYLNVAMRLMASQGFVDMQIQEGAVIYSVHNTSDLAFSYLRYYKDVVDLLKFAERYHPRKFEIEPFRVLKKIMDKYSVRYDFPKPGSDEEASIQQQVLKHIEGILVGPTIVFLGMSGMFHKYFMEASFRPEEFHKDPESFGVLLDFLAELGWFESKRGTYSFTEKGLFFARRASAYGVTVSYLPMLRNTDQLIFGDPNYLRDSLPGEKEKHVDREMNVWGSGGAHSTYFKKVDDIIIDIFNKDLSKQPKGILDMGCGNGAFLKHLFEVIEQRTLRGKHLEEYPLFLVGADFNEAAIKVSRSNLIQADIWAKVIHGDIGNPHRLAADLMEDYGIALSDLLNVRTFLDHNRIWFEPQVPVSALPTSTSSGAFVHRGRRLDNRLVEQNLLEHFQKWAPFVEQYGLLIIELHTLHPSLVAAHPGKTAVTAYDATHGFSDQYILELDVFLKIARKAGLESVPDYFCRFPDSELASVSIHLLKKL